MVAISYSCAFDVERLPGLDCAHCTSPDFIPPYWLSSSSSTVSTYFGVLAFSQRLINKSVVWKCLIPSVRPRRLMKRTVTTRHQELTPNMIFSIYSLPSNSPVAVLFQTDLSRCTQNSFVIENLVILTYPFSPFVA